MTLDEAVAYALEGGPVDGGARMTIRRADDPAAADPASSMATTTKPCGRRRPSMSIPPL